MLEQGVWSQFIWWYQSDYAVFVENSTTLLAFLLVCPLGSQHSLQCLRFADQHAHLSDKSAAMLAGIFLNRWCLQDKKHRSVCIALEPSSRYPAGSTEKQDPWLRALDPVLAPAWLNLRLPAGVLAVSKILSNRLLFERRAWNGSETFGKCALNSMGHGSHDGNA